MLVHLWSQKCAPWVHDWSSSWIGIVLNAYDGVFHLLDVKVIVEVNDVLLRAVIIPHLHVYIVDASLRLIEVSVLIDYMVELDLHPGDHLTDTIDGTHNHLVELVIDHELGLHR